VAALEEQGESEKKSQTPESSPGDGSVDPQPFRIGRVDVCIPCLEPPSSIYLRALEEAIPVKEFLFSSVKGRALARQDLIDRVRTEFFVFLDTDVIPGPRWFEKVSAEMKPGVGAVWGAAVPLVVSEIRRVKAMSVLGADAWASATGSKRYCSHDMLVRSEAVKGIRFPDWLHIGEDEFMGKFIVDGGFSFVKSDDAIAYHIPSERDFVSEYALNAYIKKKRGITTRNQVLRMFAMSVPQYVWVLLATQDMTAAKKQLMSHSMELKGYVAE
jgi:hypothetical protein